MVDITKFLFPVEAKGGEKFLPGIGGEFEFVQKSWGVKIFKKKIER